MSYNGKESESLFSLNSSGVLVATSKNTYAIRTITPGQGITILNGNGVSGNPSITSKVPTLTAGSYTKSNLTVNSDGYISSLASGTAGVAPTYRGSTTSGAYATTTTTLALPSGTVSGDFLVFMSAASFSTYPTSSGNTTSNGWTQVVLHGQNSTSTLNAWFVTIYTRTVTSSDITAGNIPVTTTTGTGTVLNFCSISTFAAGAYVSSIGVSPLINTSGVAPVFFTLTPTQGDVSANPNVFWLAQASMRGTGQTNTSVSPGTLIGSQYTNTNGTHSTYYYSGFPSNTLPLFNMSHIGGGSQVSTACGDAVVGILATS